MSVLDASLLVDALTTATPLGDAARRRLGDSPRWHAPAHLPAEALAAIRRRERRGEITPRRAEEARQGLARSRFALHEFAPFANRAWALRANLTVYDAWYVALAERLGTSLVTTDGRLARSPGPTCPIDLVEP